MVRLIASSWVLGAVISVLAWQSLPVMPTVGFDPSWSLALQMAAVERLHWGTQVVFNYGPLGFLRGPSVAYTWPAILGFVYLTAVRVSFATSIVWVVRQRSNLAIAVVMAFVAAALSRVDAAVPLAFVWCAVAVSQDSPRLARRIVLFGGGVVSAVELLVKLNDGLLILAMCGVAAIAMAGSRTRNVACFCSVLVTSLLALWFATGQGVSNAGDFVVGAVQSLRGYSSALESAGESWAVAAALVTWALALGAGWVVSLGPRRSCRMALVALVLLFGFALWKEGFVRQDPSHMALFFGWMLAPWVAFQWPGRHAWPLAACFAAVAVLYFAATGTAVQERLDPIASARTAVSNARTVLVPGRRQAVRRGAMLAMRSDYGLDRRTLALIGNKTVMPWPWENGLAWAYGLSWIPLPTLQTTAAYTSWLDGRDASEIASPDGPERILRHATRAAVGAPYAVAANPYSVDGRFAPYDAPAATMAMLCHFTALRTTHRYQVLGRVADRCGAPRLLRSTPASYGQTVRVPRAPGSHRVVFARIHGTTPAGLEAVRTFLFRAPPSYIVFNGSVAYRFAPNVAADGLILDAPPRADFPPPFALSPAARTIELRKQASPLSRQGAALRFDFYAMRVATR